MINICYYYHFKKNIILLIFFFEKKNKSNEYFMWKKKETYNVSKLFNFIMLSGISVIELLLKSLYFFFDI